MNCSRQPGGDLSSAGLKEDGWPNTKPVFAFCTGLLEQVQVLAHSQGFTVSPSDEEANMDLIMCQGCTCESPAKGSGKQPPGVCPSLSTPALPEHVFPECVPHSPHQHRLNTASQSVSLTSAHQHRLNTASRSVSLTPHTSTA